MLLNKNNVNNPTHQNNTREKTPNAMKKVKLANLHHILWLFQLRLEHP